jgi:4'-phosphopantetheinyl transferase
MPAFNPQNLHFNLSHSGKLALLAIRPHHPVGVDVEWMRPLPDADSIVSSHFSAIEQQAYFAVAPAQQPQAFYNGWTRKEAFIKAHGLGLSFPLKRFALTLTPNEPAKFLWVDDAYDDGQVWDVAALKMPANYAGAVVSVGHDWTVEIILHQPHTTKFGG